MLALVRTLDRLPTGREAIVRHVLGPSHAPEWSDRLAEIGFVAGERVMVIARARPGGDPLAVRVGRSTFALRCAEAACVQVDPIEPAPAGVQP